MWIDDNRVPRYLGDIEKEIFCDFKQAYPATREICEKYRGIIPNQIISLWEDFGFGTFKNGLVKLVNPDEYIDIVRSSYANGVTNPVPIFVTAFDDVVVIEDYGKEIIENHPELAFRLLVYRYNDVLPFKLELHHVLKCMYTEEFDEFDEEWSKEKADIFCNKSHYEAAVKRLGELAYDECFAYEPLLALGGKHSADSLVKVNAPVHLQIIDYLTGGIELQGWQKKE